ncbi:MAG: hypothetical protein NTV94_18960 [Planctomycetota bacterium]|nr:hypothetical protein [Planctomycetota bacterium]
MIENSAAIQTFGLPRTSLGAMSNLLELPRRMLEEMGPKQVLLTITGQDPKVLGRIDYRTHTLFQGMYDANPRYANISRHC